MPKPFDDADRRAIAARMMLDAKIDEYVSHVICLDQARAEETAREAVASLRTLLDLQGKNAMKMIRRGY